MKPIALVPVLWTKDFDAAIDFYQRGRGFACAHRMEGWASLIKDEHRADGFDSKRARTLRKDPVHRIFLFPPGQCC
jgi:catechol 2,3-dioxygenase-like lactoylglutathione lyase family enzyme